ncbi:hypothetical protein [Zooshikella ganghwensis]|uniref:Type II secretion system protein GspF domain-containing protein n=1 Tax=Zooshikella ganghwensis TaxID=202772 RepID=A0A4P9VK28_9GAMM|nr:hypothetical protein [Zooshikella ganghwensis]RDH42597.1 hypothetical protein B9G39_03565 [Zooshikella ganghwensis]
MPWKRFGYICRKASADYKDHEDISVCLKRAENDTACDLYGDNITINSWPRKILDGISTIQEKQNAQWAIEAYSGLNISQQLEFPMKFKRVIAYLICVTLTFYILAGIYQFKVAPSFIEVFDNFKMSIPNRLLFYQECWKYFVFAVSVTLVLALIIGFKMGKLFKFTIGVEDSFIIKYLMFKSIRKSYQRVIEILQFPILCAKSLKQSNDSPIITHLQVVKSLKMCISKEMQELIEHEMQSICENCEKQMKLVSVLVALIAVAAIFFFLISAYSPLFLLGEIA